MAYNDFTLEELKRMFTLSLFEDTDFFTTIHPVAISDILAATLEENIPLAIAISTEKARSEMIIAPILIEVRRQMQHRVSLFSGVEFTVAPEQGLRGICDYLISLSKEQLTIESPVIALVEAKNENMKQGINQCIAEMVAAQLFNAQRGTSISTIFGVVTTGSNWRFLRLQETNVYITRNEFYIKDVELIVGILIAMVKDAMQEHT